MNQIDADRTEDRANQKGEKNRIYVVRLVMVETKLMVAHIHEREENRATGKREEEKEW